MRKTGGILFFLFFISVPAHGDDFMSPVLQINSYGLTNIRPHRNIYTGQITFGSLDVERKLGDLTIGSPPWFQIGNTFEQKNGFLYQGENQHFDVKNIDDLIFWQKGIAVHERRLIIGYRASKELNFGLASSSFGLSARLGYDDGNIHIRGGIFKDRVSRFGIIMNIEF